MAIFRLDNVLLCRAAMALSGLLLAVTCSADSTPDPATRTTVDHGLHYLQEEAFRWKETKGCAACHHAATMIWTFNEARARGYSVDEKSLKVITTWAFEDMRANSLAEQAPPRDVINLGWVYVLLGIETARSPTHLTAASTAPEIAYLEEEPIRSARKTLIQQIVRKQTGDGSWGRPLDERVPLGGPVEDIAILSRTALVESGDQSSEVTDCISKATDWLDANCDKNSRQARNLRLLMNIIDGKPRCEWTNALEAIALEQNPDGGWSQTPEMGSDAYATGQSLYVLARAGVTADTPVLSRGVAFLSHTQLPDGAWPMTSRVKAKNPNPITGAGTAWALLGLIRAAPGDAAPSEP
jgi:hypothetical protein